MTKFTDLLDNYLLALGTFNQAHLAHEVDPLRYGKEYRDSSETLRTAKAALNTFFNSIQESLSGLTTP